MSKGSLVLLLAGIILSGASIAVPAEESVAVLQGTVALNSGPPMEGVAVSVHADGSTIRTTVYTDAKGKYHFPALEHGTYRMTAQAVGFLTAKATARIAEGKISPQNFSMQDFPDFEMQLSSAEWIDNLPAATPQDRRMKAVVARNCTSCHVAGLVLQNRFDKDGWDKILTWMSRISIFGYIPSANLGGLAEDGEGYIQPSRAGIQNHFVNAYQHELTEYLTKARGPQRSNNYKPYPRPTGEATQVVVTEYDISPTEAPGYILTHNGSDWSEGTPSAYEASSAHDCWPDREGNVWFTDDHSPERTIGKLDSRTGKVTSFKLPGKNNLAINSHGIIVDPKGFVWFTNMQEAALTRFDPKTEEFQRFPRPESMAPVRSTILLDSDGNLWAPRAKGGAFKLNTTTGVYTEYKPKPGVKEEDPYGIAVDGSDNAWYAMMNSDRMGHANARTGEVSMVALEPVNRQNLTAKDFEIGNSGAPNWNSAPPYQKGPRRLGADTRGNTVWVSLFWEGKLARIDIRTNKVKEFTLPHPSSTPYSAIVDKNHMVWVNLMNLDRIAKFNPITERFTEYPLPTLGTETRFISVDDTSDPPAVWVPYYRTNKLARVQFRTQ